MKYMGSKTKIAKHILPIMLASRAEGQYWVEPFVGGGNMIDKVEGDRIGADFNHHVINALNLIKRGETPADNQEYTEYDYKVAQELVRCGFDVSETDSYALIAFSFGGKWAGGWSRGNNSDGTPRDYVAEQHRASNKQSPKLKGVTLVHSSYSELEIPPNSIIYCDPPYEGTTGYKDTFDHVKFWQWCRGMSRQGHTVFVSEYNAPDDFLLLWEKDVNVSVAKSGKHKRETEKLFLCLCH